MIWKFKHILIACLFSFNVSAQLETTWQQKPTFNLSGFMDVFYMYDFGQPQGATRQPFLYNHNRHNEFNLNLGLVTFAVENPKYRATIGLQTGTYANDNYAAEPGLLKNIFEANVEVSLNTKNNLWLKAGVMPSHIGFESAISVDNLTLTRSLLAENSPYFLTGAKLTYSPNEKLELAGLVVNGWQRVQRLDGNSMLSFGTQLNYTPSKKININWSTFIGTDDPDSTRRMRYFNNLFGQFEISKKIRLIAGFDFGVQQQMKSSVSYDYWFSPIVIGQISLNTHWDIGIRIEHYADENGVIIGTGTVNGFQTTGTSLNLDYSPTKNVVCRIEGRWLNSFDAIFTTKTNPSNDNFVLGTSIAIRF